MEFALFLFLGPELSLTPFASSSPSSWTSATHLQFHLPSKRPICSVMNGDPPRWQQRPEKDVAEYYPSALKPEKSGGIEPLHRGENWSPERRSVFTSPSRMRGDEAERGEANREKLQKVMVQSTNALRSAL